MSADRAAPVVGARQVAKSGSAGGSVSAPEPVVVGQSGGAAVAAVPVTGGISIKVTADGAVVLVHGSMTMHAMASSGGGGKGDGSAKDAGPGEWQPVNENMSDRARKYQEQITGKSADYSYVVRGVRFDGYKNGKLLDAKGEGYDHFIKEGDFYEWFKSKGRKKLVNQARNQVDAAGGVRIEWHVAQEDVAQVLRKTFAGSKDLSTIKIVHTPMK